MTLYPLKLSNCDNLTYLAYLFPKCPYHIFFFLKKKKRKKKKSKKKKKKSKKYVGVAEPHGVVRPPPGRPIWGWPNHPQWPRGWVVRPLPGRPIWGWFSRPLGQTPKNKVLSDWPKGRPNHPLGH
jgi:hypothetical protein